MNETNLTLHRARTALQRGQLDQTAELCRGLLAQDADNVEARYFLGLSCALDGDVDTAIGEWRSILASHPADFRTRANLGAALLQQGRAEEAIAHLQAALALEHSHARLHISLGRAHALIGQPRHAADSFARAVALEPHNVDAALGCAAALQQGGNPPAAIDQLEQAARRNPTSADLHYALAVCRHRAGQLETALISYGRALDLVPTAASALRDRSRALESLQRLPEALQGFQTALAYDAADPSLLAGALSCSLRLCAWTHLADYMQRLRQVPSGLESLHPFVALSIAEDPDDQRRCAAVRGPAATAPIPTPTQAGEARAHGGGSPAAHDRDARIRIAYVSSDLGDHPVGRLLCSLIEHHDRAQFEVIGVALGTDPHSNPEAARLRAAFESYHEAGRLDDASVAALLRESGVDIAIDLNGYTSGGRPAIFAHRAAPVQVNYLGYAGTLGAAYIDYLIADEVVIPHGAEQWYAEKVVRLPHCYLPSDNRRALADPPTRAQVGLPEQGLVWCAFTNNYKISPSVFDVWMRLLTAVPGSVLWLRAGHPVAAENLRQEARARGVEPDRLVFAPPLPGMAEHLARQRLADLYLDTLPYNAHSTTCDALWAGLPVLTCAGRSFASRVAASALTAVGLPELITSSLAEYERRALELTQEPGRLQALRAHLERQQSTSPLFDCARYARHLESAYTRMHQRRVRGEPPESFAVAPDAGV